MHTNLKRALYASLALTAVAICGAGQAKADDTQAEIRALKAELRILEAKVNAQARQQQKTQAVVTSVVESHAYKGAPVLTACPPDKFCYKGITITPTGFIDLAGIYRSRNMNSDLGTPWNSIPYGNNRVGRTDEARFSARASRFGLKVEGNVDPYTKITGYGEIDFQGGAQTANNNQSNSYNPRLRQAYLAVDRTDIGLHVEAGQTWSLATMFKSGLTLGKENIPLTIDQQYLPGFTYLRQPGIRVTKDLGPFTIGASAENPASIISSAGTLPNNLTALTTTGNGTGANGCQGFTNTVTTSAADSSFDVCNSYSLNHIPDLIGKVAWDSNFSGHDIHLEGYGIFRDFYDRTGASPAAAAGVVTGGSNHDVYGGGAGGGILVSVIPKFIDFQFSGLTGSGVGRYGVSQLPDVTLNPDGTYKTIPNTQLLAGVTVHATPNFDIYGYAGTEFVSRTTTNAAGTLGYGVLNANNSGCNVEGSTVCGAQTKSLESFAIGANDTIYSGSYGKLVAGIEYNYTRKEAFSTPNGPLVGGVRTVAGPKTDDNIVMTSLRYFPF